MNITCTPMVFTTAAIEEEHMIKLLGLGIITFALLAEGQLPSSAVGKWTVGKPYDVGQPVGLDAKQEGAIVGQVIKVSPSQLAVCGKDVPITSVKVDHLTSSDFLAKIQLHSKPNWTRRCQYPRHQPQQAALSQSVRRIC